MRDFVPEGQLMNDKPLSPNFEQVGLETRFFVLLYSQKLTFWAIFFLMYPVFFALAAVTQWKPCRSISASYKYNSIIRMTIELYLEMCLFAFINLYSV